MFKITSIDKEKKAVYVHFEVGDYVLDHTVFVEDIDDPGDIQATIAEHYEKFKDDLKAAEVKIAPLKQEVQDLIGVEYEID